jgi:hypothetical protein
VRYHWELRPAEGETPATLSYRPHRVTRLIGALRSLGMAVDTGPPPRFPLWALYGVSDFDSAGRPLGERAAEVAADAYLGKPFDLDDLLEVVSRYLRHA